MKKIAILSDTLFSFFASALLACCFLRYLRLGFNAAVFLGTLTGLAVAALTFFLLDKKRRRYSLGEKETKLKNELIFHLRTLYAEERLELFREIFSRADDKGEPLPLPVAAKICRLSYAGSIKTSTHVCDERCFSEHLPDYIETPTDVYFPVFRYAPIDADGLFPIFSAIAHGEFTDKCVTVLGDKFDEECKKLCRRFSVYLLTGDEVYRMMKKSGGIPAATIGTRFPVPRGKRRHTLWFAKSNSKRFLGSGVLLLLSSLITPFPFYYLVFGTALVFTAIFVRIFGFR